MIAVMQRIFVCVLSTCIGTAIVAFGSAAILFLLALRAWGVVRAAALKPAWGHLSPRSTLVGQGSSDSPPGCHSLLPQFGESEPSDSLLCFAAVIRSIEDMSGRIISAHEKILETAAKRKRGSGTMSPSRFGRQPNVPPVD